MNIDRLGRFEVSTELIREFGTKISPLFKDVIVTRAEGLWHKGTIEYIGFSDKFEPVLEGEVIPSYRVMVYNIEGRMEFSFERLYERML